MMKIIYRNKSNDPKTKYLEKHHIIPRAWFKYHKFNVDNSNDNIVYLSCSDHLRVHVLLYYYFNLIHDEKMSSKTCAAIYIMTRQGSHQLKHSGYISEECYKEYERIKKEYYDRGYYKNRKYTDEYLRQCFDLYKQYDDSQKGFEAVCQQLGFKYTKRKTLQERLKKYIPKEEYDAVIKRQVDWYIKNKTENSLKNRPIIIEQRKMEREKIKNEKIQERIENLREDYLKYQKYGTRYMKFKNPKFKAVQLMKNCLKYKIIDSYTPRNTEPNKITIEGETGSYSYWCDKLKVDRIKMLDMHKCHNLSYQKLFEMVLDGTFNELKLTDEYVEMKRNKIRHQKSENLNDIAKLFKQNSKTDEEYVELCDFYESTKSVYESLMLFRKKHDIHFIDPCDNIEIDYDMSCFMTTDECIDEVLQDIGLSCNNIDN